MIPRTGIGFDTHRLVADRRLVLGGVEIPHALGLLGHSDADVLAHAIMDALLGAEVPTIEVHLSNVFKREAFRHHSYIALAAKGVICGLGVQGYLLALEAIKGLVSLDPPPRN